MSAARIVLVVTLAASGAMPAGAQWSQPRQGFWAGIGGGSGSASVSCRICRESGTSATAAYVNFGGVVRDYLLLGAELDGWRRADAEVTRRAWSASAIAMIYPSRRVPAHLKLGVGIVRYSASDGEDLLHTTSPAAKVGVGVDVPVGRASLVTPYATLIDGWRGHLKLNDRDIIDPASARLTHFGIGISLR